MDNDILSILSIVISVLSVIIGVINHKRIVSKCCGRQIDASLDINNTTPVDLKIKAPDINDNLEPFLREHYPPYTPI